MLIELVIFLGFYLSMDLPQQPDRTATTEPLNLSWTLKSFHMFGTTF